MHILFVLLSVLSFTCPTCQDSTYLVAVSSSCVTLNVIPAIVAGAQSTLGGTTFLPEKYACKINKMPNFT